jgi:hypothetical protein
MKAQGVLIDEKKPEVTNLVASAPFKEAFSRPRL